MERRSGGPPRTVQCGSCGQMFFPASLRFHVKACKKKQANLDVPCPHCDVEVKRAAMPRHLRRCAAAKADRRARQTLQHEPMVWSEGGAKHGVVNVDAFPGRSGGGLWAAEQRTAASSDGRSTCAICKRKFSSARITQHQRICRAVRRKEESRGVFRSQGQRLAGHFDAEASAGGTRSPRGRARVVRDETPVEQTVERRQQRRLHRNDLRRTIAARRADALGGGTGGGSDFGVKILVSPRNTPQRKAREGVSSEAPPPQPEWWGGDAGDKVEGAMNSVDSADQDLESDAGAAAAVRAAAASSGAAASAARQSQLQLEEREAQMHVEVDEPRRSSTKEELAPLQLQPQQQQQQQQPQPPQRRHRSQEEPCEQRRAAEYYDAAPLSRSSSKGSSRSDGSERLPLCSPRSASSPSAESAPALALASSKGNATAPRGSRGASSSSSSSSSGGGGSGRSGGDGGSTKWSRLFLTPKEEAQAAEQLGTNWTDVQWIFKLAYGASLPSLSALFHILAPSLPQRLSASAHSRHVALRHLRHNTMCGAHRALQAGLSRE